MTRKHLETIARRINERQKFYRSLENHEGFPSRMALRDLACDLADEFVSLNERFDRKRFMTACGF